MIRVAHVNGSPENEPQVHFGSYFDGEYFFFFESDEEHEEFIEELHKKNPPPVNVDSNVKSPLFELSHRDIKSSEIYYADYLKSFSMSSSVDYFVYRLLYLRQDFYFFNDKLVKTAGDCIEKMLKCYYISHNTEIDPKDYSHKILNLLEDCAKIDPFFEKKELFEFCEGYSMASNKTKGHQIFGYSLFSYIELFNVDYGQLLDLLDEFFLTTILKIKDNKGLFFFDVYSIYTGDFRGKARFIHKPDSFEEFRNVYVAQNKYIEPLYLRNKVLIDNYFTYKR